MKQRLFLPLCLVLFCLFPNCKKKGDRLPLVTTLNASAISDREITCGGVLYSKGDGDLLQCGLCWSTNPEPTINDKTTDAGTDEGNFSQTITGLVPNTTYYVRAFATSELGTTYGETMKAKTVYENNSYVADIDGNVYKTVKIGSKIWTAENLKVTRYRNGDPIYFITSYNDWVYANYGGYCYYLNNFSNVSLVGYLYNWYAVSDARSIAPAGWHVATYFDYMDLVQTLSPKAADKMKAVHSSWASTQGATNASGFTAFPGGKRYAATGNFDRYGYDACFWTSTPNGGLAVNFELAYYSSEATSTAAPINTGMSVRLVKD